MIQYAGDPDISKNTARIPHPYRLEQAQDFTRGSLARHAAGKSMNLVISLKGSDPTQPTQLIGMIGLNPDASGKLHLGFWMGKPFWGKGYMTRAVNAMLRLAFEDLKLPCVYSWARRENAASQHIMTSFGFDATGHDSIDAPMRAPDTPLQITRFPPD
jgi:RimJ/RimL family protein N-acetyltransferase